MSSHLHHNFSWSDLPRELLESIAGHLKSNPDDLRSFRCVCKHWSIAPPPLTGFLHVPVKIPSIYRARRNSPPAFHPFFEPSMVISTGVYLLRPPNRPSATRWLVSVEQLSPGKVRLLHPLTRLPIETSTLPDNFPKNIPDLSFIEMSKGFYLRYSDDRTKERFCPSKVLLWPNPYCKATTATPGTDEQILVVVLNKGGDLVCFCPNSRTNNYYFIPISSEDVSGRVNKFDDIVNRDGIVVAVDREGRVHEIEYRTKKASIMCSVTLGIITKRRKRLLLDSNTNELYLIVRDQGTKKHTNFRVFRMNSEERKWDQLTSLGDRVLFVSFDTCFFVRARDLPGFQRNSIVFPKDCFPVCPARYKYDDSFKAAEGSGCSEVGVYRYGEGNNFKLISADHGFSDALWPPPTWIWEDMSTVKSFHS